MAHSLNKFQDQDIKTEDDVIGKTDHDFYAASRADTYRADDEAVMASGIPMVNRLEPAPEPLGSPRLVTTSKIPLRDKEGRLSEWRASREQSKLWIQGKMPLGAWQR